jgi:hypothetical protein
LVMFYASRGMSMSLSSGVFNKPLAQWPTSIAVAQTIQATSIATKSEVCFSGPAESYALSLSELFALGRLLRLDFE